MSESRRSRRIPWLSCSLVLLAAASSLAFALGRCGDGVCEGPETPTLCPEDCGDGLIPNPMRAVVSEEILTWRNWLADGGFEEGDAAVESLAHPGSSLAPARVRRLSAAARTGSYGMRIESETDEGILFAVRSPIEKGEVTRCSLWARSLGGPVELPVSVLGVDSGAGDSRTLYEPGEPFSVGPDWTKIEFTFESTHGVQYALYAIDIGPDRTIDVDDVAIEAEQWAEPSVCRFERTLGGIRVPMTPRATVHFNVLIHIEDPQQITRNEAYFLERTAVFTELARVLHEHGGFLTIQPEEDWPMAALQFAPDTLADLAETYRVAYSTHTHGPACIDPDGRLRSNQDCNSCRTCPGWEMIETDRDPTTPEYVGALRELISEVSGTDVTDHNGNFHYSNPEGLAGAGVETWSAFKDHNTQSTFDELYTNPWRPTPCDAIESPQTFQTHDPTTPIVFIPGWGQAITRNPERIHERLAGMLGQILCYADPNRINTFYIVTHVDHYRGDGEPYIEVDEQTREVTFHEAFLRDLGHWEETLTELIDPLVAEGYLTWTSLPEIGELFATWEATQGRD